MNATGPEDVHAILPEDADQALLIGRVWDVESGGPRVVAVSGGSVFDLHRLAGTVADLLELPDRRRVRSPRATDEDASAGAHDVAAIEGRRRVEMRHG